MHTPTDKYQVYRDFLNDDFVNISDKEIQSSVRIFGSVRTLVHKGYDVNPLVVYNKAMALHNVFDHGFVCRRLRRTLRQDMHGRLNSLLLLTNMEKNRVEDGVPYDIDYFKFLMKR